MRRLAMTSAKKVVKLVYLNLPAEIRTYLIPLNQLKQSGIFRQYWAGRGDEVKEERSRSDQGSRPLTLNEILKTVIEPVFEKWRNTRKVVKNGNISLDDVKKLFGTMLGKENQLAEELRYMDEGETKPKWIKERVKQILRFSKLDLSSNAARAVNRVCKVLDIEPFPAILRMQEQNSPKFRRQPLSIMTKELVLAGHFLAEMTESETKCLDQFAECEVLVIWVRQELKEWKELETFVELVGTRSSAEGDFETIKVAHLRAACAGFSSLLFDVKENVNLDQFQASCKTVFSKLSRDKNIPKKWCDTQKYLADFKVMKECLGSVEVSSFSEVDLINSRGQYSLGCRSTEAPQDISDCISLEIKASDTSGAATTALRKKYSLSDLQDLQSKLILISGYKDERRNEVDVFVDTLECATRLAVDSVALCRAGHVKYLNWTKNVDCVSPLKQLDDPEREGKAHLQLIDGLLNDMRKTATDMEKDLDEWKRKMCEVRSKCYYLNYFSTAQLLILGRQLGQLAHYRNRNLPNYVYGLLECIKSNINANDVSSSMGKACARRNRPPPRRPPQSSMFSQSTFGGSFGMGGEPSFDISTFDSPESFLGFQAPMDVEHSGWTSHQILTDPEPEPVPEVSPFNLDNPEYLSLEILGSFLETLAQSARQTPARSFRTEHLTLGKPNLIVVCEAELIQTVLGFYMEDPDRSLPSAQEVLLCSVATTAEDVTLFWRRAIKDPSQSCLFLPGWSRSSDVRSQSRRRRRALSPRPRTLRTARRKLPSGCRLLFGK
eukprot:m.300392 g.300392  ORF g.300392 m.300392 type:complete len:777 (+) comp40798_c0_seq2:3410-5740(+)